MKKFLLLFLLFGFFASVPATITVAQDFDFGDEDEDEGPKVINQYDDKYRPNQQYDDYGTKDFKPQGAKLVPNFFYYGIVTRPSYAGPDDLNLTMMSPGSVSGCLYSEPPSVKTEIAGKTLKIEMVDPLLDADWETVRYFHYDCKTQTTTQKIDITLSKDRLIRNDINKIVLANDEFGTVGEFEIELDKNKIVVKADPLYEMIFGRRGRGGKQVVTHWFYPENTLVLFSSSIDLRDEKNREKAIALGRSKGLVPLEEVLEGFETGDKKEKLLYMVDTANVFSDETNEESSAFVLGTVTAGETFYGPQGAYEKPVKKPIYAKSPGLYE